MILAKKIRLSVILIMSKDRKINLITRCINLRYKNNCKKITAKENLTFKMIKKLSLKNKNVRKKYKEKN